MHREERGHACAHNRSACRFNVPYQPSTDRYGNRPINDINASDSERGYGRPQSSAKTPGPQARRWSLARSGCAGHVPEKYHTELGGATAIRGVRPDGVRDGEEPSRFGQSQLTGRNALAWESRFDFRFRFD
jgi:hypothetical protein